MAAEPDEASFPAHGSMRGGVVSERSPDMLLKRDWQRDYCALKSNIHKSK